MHEFLLFFRMDITSENKQPTPAQMEGYMAQWQQWIEKLTGMEKLAGGNHLATTGAVLKPGNVVSNEIYTADKESVAGYFIVLADSLKEAVDLAKSCPILQGEGTSVEVRQVAGR